LKETPDAANRTLRAVMKANRFLTENRQETIAIMMKWLPQSQEVASRSYDVELKSLAKDGQMTDEELESVMERLGEKRRPLDDVRDFSFMRRVIRELDGKQ
jgi:ABC-type nitrate/sulfonate/bicarbonate transport system substrate-binding protein